MKSALDLAMERAAAIKIDVKAVKKDAGEKEGRRLAAKALEEEDFNLKEALEALPADIKKPAFYGAAATLLANLVLPTRESELVRLAKVGAVLTETEPQTGGVVGQLEGFFRQYLTQRQDIMARLEAHFAPLLRQHEERMMQQTGRRVSLSIESVPEAYKAYQEEISHFDRQYQEELDKVKEDFQSFFTK
jgi:hypothetical protein